MIPLWFLWLVFFAAVIAESFQWFLLITLPTWIMGPIAVLIFWFGSRAFVVYMRSAKHFLDNAKIDIDASRVAEDFTTYMNLLFPVLIPTKAPSTDSTTLKQQRIRKTVLTLKIMPIIEVVVLGIVIFSFVSFFIRHSYILPGLLRTPIIPFLWFNFAIMVIRLGIFLRWRQYVIRWLTIYEGLTTWQANLELAIQQNANISQRVP